MVYFILIVLLIFICCSVESAEFGIEFCQLETFNPKCTTNEVVYIEKAAYGRMRKGKCITDEELKSFGSLIYDKKYFQCSVDVSELLHEKCSFQQECNVPVSYDKLKMLNPCLPGVFLNLEVKYKCLSVYQAEKPDCHFQVSQISKHFLFESFRIQTCGRQNYPLIFEAPKGQKVSVLVVGQDEFKSGGELNYCEGLGIILQDGYNGANSSLCASVLNGQTLKYGHSFTSTQNVLKVYITDINIASKRLALKFQAEGCSDIIPPEDAWLKRTNDDVVVGCYSSKLTWYLRCEQRKWVGTLGNCSFPSAFQQKSLDEMKQDKDKILLPKNQQILVIVCIFGAGVILCSLIICTGAVLSRRYSIINKAKPVKLASQCMNYEDGQYQYNAYTDRYNFTNDSKVDPIESDEQKNVMNNNPEVNQTYFVLEDEQE